MIVANITSIDSGLNMVNVFDNYTDDFYGMGITSILEYDEISKTLTTSGLTYKNVDCLVFNY